MSPLASLIVLVIALTVNVIVAIDEFRHPRSAASGIFCGFAAAVCLYAVSRLAF